MHLLGPFALAAGQLPHQAVVEAELLDEAAANAVDPAVADVAHPRSLGAQHEGGGRGAHAVEVAVLRAARMDGAVGLDKSLAQRGCRPFAGMLGIDVRDVVDGHLARQLADRVGAHAVGDQEHVAALPPLFRLGGRHQDVGVLIMAAANPHVGEARVFDVVEASHPASPRPPCGLSLPPIPDLDAPRSRRYIRPTHGRPNRHPVD